MADETSTDRPLTVVLVHGAFADSSSCAGVIERLQRTRRPGDGGGEPLTGHRRGYTRMWRA